MPGAKNRALQFGHDVSVVENSIRSSALLFVIPLQFGHDVSVVENQYLHELTAECDVTLQFGHDVSVVENLPRPLRPPRRCTCFNLATTSASWRTVSQTATPILLAGLQFGHDVSVVENASMAWAARSTRRPCFNLATTSASWRTNRTSSSVTAQSGFNLATTSASWRTAVVGLIG